MRYLLQIYPGGAREAGERLPPDEQEAIREEYLALGQTPGSLGGAALQPVETATTVRVQDGETLLTDGPFVDAKEHLGGFCLVEADDIDAALEVAARIPAARMGGAIEIRPVVEGLALMERAFREEWGRVLATMTGFLGDLDRAEEAARLAAFAVAAER